MSRSTSDPFTIGNVVSAGVRLYRDRLGAYFGIAFIATLWWFLPGWITRLVTTLLTAAEVTNGIIALVSIIGLVFSIYGIAKSLANTALISRLAFGYLNNQPEAVSEARKNILPRMWRFLFVAILIFFIFVFFNIGLILAISILNAIVSAVLQSVGILMFVWGMVVFLGYIIANLWLFTRLFIPEVSLAIEGNINSSRAISRSWELTKGSVLRIQGIILVTILVTIPLYFLAFSPMAFAFSQEFGGILAGNVSQVVQFFVTSTISIVGTYLLFGVVNIFVVPLWQSIKAVIYYDLCSRREGLDLEIKK